MNTNWNQKLNDLFPVAADIPTEIRLEAPLHQRNLLIGGEFINWAGTVHTVLSPIYVRQEKGAATEAPFEIGSYPLATSKEALLALDAAIKAYDGGRGEWPSGSLEKRVHSLEGFTKSMVSKREEIVKLIVWEIGKSIPDAQKEFDRTVEYIEETIKAAKVLSNKSSAFTIQQNVIGQIKKVAHGVVLSMGPFNYPLNETFTTLIPALIMGNTILFKPPKHGTLLFSPLLELFQEHFPKGVVNTVYGRGRDVVSHLMESGKVDVLALIGSSKVADSLKKMHPKSNRLKAVLGLDAKNVGIILRDADIELAVRESVAGALSFNGQRCTALKIFFVHSSIVDAFNTMLTAEIEKLTIGMPWQNGVFITPLAEPAKPAYLQDIIVDALAKGAKIINQEHGGGSMNLSLVKPTILFPVTSDMKVYKEEQFGPVIPVIAFDSFDQPIDYIRESDFGQQVSLFSSNPEDLSYFIDALASQVGRININSQSQRSPDTFPFNGRKDSAEGTLSVEEALLAFSVDSVVAAKQTFENEQLLNTIVSDDSSKRLNNHILA